MDVPYRSDICRIRYDVIYDEPTAEPTWIRVDTTTGACPSRW